MCTGLPAVNQAFDEDQQLLYLELRAEAALHAKLRAESFMKAAHARSKKQYEVAQYYAQQVSGCGHTMMWVWFEDYCMVLITGSPSHGEDEGSKSKSC